MKKEGKFIQFLMTTILILSVICCIMVIAQVMSKGYVNIGGYSFFHVVTGSMEPTIPKGSLIINKREEIEEIKVGDIICFRSQESYMLGQTITHRVVEKKKGKDGNIYLETRGDANYASDGYYVTSQNLIGEVVFYTGKGNIIANIISFLTTKMGFMTCIVFPVLLVTGGIMRDSVQSMNKDLEALKREQEKEPYEESYEEMVERLKKEILEEVKQSVKREDTTC